jgi:hypothetical protein
LAFNVSSGIGMRSDIFLFRELDLSEPNPLTPRVYRGFSEYRMVGRGANMLSAVNL